MFVRIILTAILAGVFSGLFVTGVQSVRVIPLIHQAEQYEDAGAGSHAASHASEDRAADQMQHDHDAVWEPADGAERLFYTGLSNVIAGVAFSLLLTAGIVLAGRGIDLMSGLVWGACGFVTFVLAPNFGLPPELPGMAAADLVSRQIWWVATVVATAAALYLFAFHRRVPLMVLGTFLMMAPHLYGAPRPESHDTAVPASLAAEFAVATIVSSALFWVFLGGVLGIFLGKLLRTEQTG